MTTTHYNWRAMLAAAFALMSTNAAAGAIERIEPPNWWVGMHAPTVQLMVHGDDIGQFTVSTNHPGVTVLRTTPGDSRNYLFVDLLITPSAPVGDMTLQFRRGDVAIEQRYALQPRRPGSAERRGFSNRDVILNLMPDRYANGNTGNDDWPGFDDKADRNDGSSRHGGDLQGMTAHLPDIAAMGFTAIWPTPLTESNQPRYSYHGYAATDTYRIDPRFGGNAAYLDFVRAAKRQGLCVIQDIVLNHIGSNHWWVSDLPFADWLTHGGKFAPTGHARTTALDPYAAAADRESFTRGWFTPDMPDMNQRNPFVATYQIQNTLWWIETADLCGLRIDTYGYSDHAFLGNWSQRVRDEYPDINIVGEEWSDNPVVVSRWLDGSVLGAKPASHLPSVMDFPLYYAMQRALTEPESLHSGLQVLYEAMVNDVLYPNPQNLVAFEGNHDVARVFSALDGDDALYRMALTWLLTVPRIPQLYYGTDIQMTSPKQRDDPAFRRDYPGGWPGDVVNAFSGEGLTRQQADARKFLRRLLNWRRHQPAVHRGAFLHYAPQSGAYVYFRYDGVSRIMVVLNKNTQPVALPTERYAEGIAGRRTGRDVLTGTAINLAGATLQVPPRSSLILELN